MITAHKNNHIKRIPADKKLNIALDAIRRQETVVDISKRYDVSSPYRRVNAVAVGTSVTSCPPHRSGRALLTHPAPTLGEWRKSAAQDKGGLSLA